MAKNSQVFNNIGHKIRELRKQKKLTQKELADKIGSNQTTIAAWENQRNKIPNKKFIESLSKVLNTSEDYLVGLDQNLIPKIPCYGEVKSQDFLWSNSSIVKYYIDIPQCDYSSSCFALKIKDDLLEPFISKGDYGIFDKLTPKNGDIVVIKLPGEKNKAMIKMWRQRDKKVMLSGTNFEKIDIPYFLEIASRKSLTFQMKNPKKKVVIEGKLIAVKRILKHEKNFSGINYIFL